MAGLQPDPLDAHAGATEVTATFTALLLRRCRKCKHQWLKRREQDPKVCPKCKRTDWNGK